jgi:hypothetical protein
VATKKSKDNPHQWPDGSWHSVSWQQHLDAIQLSGHSVVSLLPPTSSQKVPSTPLTPPTLPPPQTWAESHDGPPIQPQPYDPGLEQSKLQAGLNIGLSDAEAGYQSDQAGYRLGFNADGSANTSNPWSQAMQLEQNYKRSQTGTTNSLAAQGQLYSGAMMNAQARNDRLYAQDYAGLKDTARDTYHNIGAGRLSTYASNAQGLSGDAFASLRKSIYGS